MKGPERAQSSSWLISNFNTYVENECNQNDLTENS